MGDIVNSLPVAAALQQAYPDSIVDWVIEERWQELLCARGTSLDAPRNSQKPLVNTIHTVNTRSWRDHPLAKRTWSEISALRRNIREREYTAVIDVQGAIRSAVIARFSSATRIVGFDSPRERPARHLYKQKINAQGVHIIEQNVSLTSLPFTKRALEILAEMLPHDPLAENWCDAEIQKLPSARFAILSPGAGWGAKEWPPERFGEVARELARDGVASVLNIGPNENDLAAKVESTSNGATRRVSGSIGQLIALTRRAALFIGGDTGPMHLANILCVPVVAIFGPTNPERNGPYYSPYIVLRHESSETSYSHHDRQHEGLMSITSAEVVAAARTLLNK
ncbi:MAG: Lipopolysaccharide heptosyltransferase [Acidobacteriaceae bacterium]|nr:Lipopolysaccharide heptosyltransferase [Acidobacteriaceae bacterium]